MIHCIEGYDDLTYVHSINVALISRVIGKWMGLSPEECDTLTICGLLHDIGKVMIPIEIITKPSRLSPTEYALIQTHTIHGYNLLEKIELDERIKLAALQHHERCDGKGYPNKLRYNEINQFSRIVAIADVYDAMTSNRCYRKSLGFDVCYDEIEKNLGKMYDPKIGKIVLENWDKIIAVLK